MGFAYAIFGSVLKKIDDAIVNTAYYIRFDRGVYVSDHFDRENTARRRGMERISLFDGTLLAFVDPAHVEVNNYQQDGTIYGSVEKFDYINKLHFGRPDDYCVYFLTLPKYYFPKKFIVPNEPHFAARIGDEIRITWWFKEDIDVKIEIEKNPREYLQFEHIDAPNFIERHPKAFTAYREAKELASMVAGEILSS